MCSSSYGCLRLPRSDPIRFTIVPSTRPENPPQFISFRPGPRRRWPVFRCSLNDVVSEQPAMSFYELLGVRQTGSLTEIKHAYKQLARKYHPDLSPPGRIEEYTQRFIRVQEAYETLSDPSMRELYDRDMAKGVHLAFTARRRGKFRENMDNKADWKNHWQSQLSELKKRSMQKDENMSWAAKMRRQRNEEKLSSFE